MTEIELAQKFVEYLCDIYDLYYEVRNVDIVGKAGSIVIKVEVKKYLNFKVIEQAHRNIRSCHYSYIAVPWSSARNNSFGLTICERFGIGALIYNDILQEHCPPVGEYVKPHFNRGANVSFAKKLNADSPFKKATPGAKSGETVTAFSCMADEARRYVRMYPGCTIKKIFESVKHHYSSMTSARSCLIQHIDSGVIKGVRREKDKLYIDNKT
ncbi:MAG: hypothetical protein LBH58_09045 [Tannerellaceae bacterium]|jgi:hypothetical protein|nr:hypothetical protein [Tannerellaceae bacterium]